MRMLRSIDCAWLWRSRSPLSTAGAAQAQTKITVGKITSGSGFHIPSYVAMDQGFYKAEGLDASFVTLHRPGAGDRGPHGQHRLHPDPVRRLAGGAERRRDPLRGRRVAQVAWLIVARPNITKPEDLKGKTLGYGRAGSADYDEGAAVMLARLQDGGRQGLQGDLVPGRAASGSPRWSTATSMRR